MDFRTIRKLIRNGQAARVSVAVKAGTSALERACLRSGGHEYGQAYDCRTNFQVQYGAPPHVVQTCWKCGHRMDVDPSFTYQGVPIYPDGDML